MAVLCLILCIDSAGSTPPYQSGAEKRQQAWPRAALAMLIDYDFDEGTGACIMTVWRGLRDVWL